jgi:prevent-host-death family protein
MSETISQRELRNDNAAIMRRVEGGESFVVTKNGRPVADLVPHRERRPRTVAELQHVFRGAGPEAVTARTLMSRLVVLDTSVVIDLPDVDLSGVGDARPAVSAVTVAELSFSLDVDDPVERRIRSDRVDSLLASCPVLPFDVACGRMYGTLASLVKRSGRDPRPRRLDLLIAATAVTHHVPLVTRNARDFAGLERLLDIVQA